MEMQELLTQMRSPGIVLKLLRSQPVCLRGLSAGAVRRLMTGFISFRVSTGFRADGTSAESARVNPRSLLMSFGSSFPENAGHQADVKYAVPRRPHLHHARHRYVTPARGPCR